MNDLLKVFEDGIRGRNKGLNTGIPKLNRAINGIQRGMLIGVAGSPKAGKSSLVDSAFLIHPYLEMLENDNVNIDFFYWSLEMSKIDVRFRSIAFFFSYDHGITSVQLPEGQTHKGSSIIPISPSYLQGKMETDCEQRIIVTQEHQEIFRKIVEDRINPMFGEYDEQGKKIKDGKITIIEDVNDSNPTGVRNYLFDYAKKEGNFLYEDYEVIIEKKKVKKQRISGYTPNDPNKYVIVIVDHLRALKRERGFTLKENMDKLLEYQIFLRNICNFTFVDIVHLNRNISDIQRIKFNNEFLFPNDDDLKDSGNLSEAADILLTMFDATDDRYNIKKHFGLDISDIINYRSIHLVRSRNTPAPAHIQTQMYANILKFEQI